MSFDVDVSEFRNAAAVLDGSSIGDLAGDVLAPALHDVSRAVQANVRAAARPHRRTGRLEAAVTVQPSGGGIRTTVEVTAGDVANLIVGGTRPHDIAPIGAHALRLAGARQGFAARVHHPGTAPDPFVADGIRRSEGDTEQALDHAGATLVDDLAAKLGG